MESDIFDKISNAYYHLTAAEKKVADYVAVQQRQTQYMSISELAEACGVSEATISRFCRTLQYKGYNVFKLAVANSSLLRNEGRSLTGGVSAEDSVCDMCEKIYQIDVGAIIQTQQLIRPEALQQAADILLRSSRILCLGQGGSGIMAMEASHLFSTTFSGFSSVVDSHLQSIGIIGLNEEDAILYFSYSGATRDLEENLQLARRYNIKIILVTRFPKSPGAQLADVVLQCGSNENPLQHGSIAARMAQLYLLDALYTEMYRRDEVRHHAYRERVAEGLASKHI